MARSLVGYTGFVGGSLLARGEFAGQIIGTGGGRGMALSPAGYTGFAGAACLPAANLPDK
jgi:hypothetical protein